MGGDAFVPRPAIEELSIGAGDERHFVAGHLAGETVDLPAVAASADDDSGLSNLPLAISSPGAPS